MRASLAGLAVPKKMPLEIICTGITLGAAPPVLLGATQPVRCTNYHRIILHTMYTLGAGGVSYPELELLGSKADPWSVAGSVADFGPVPNFDAASYAAGAVDQYPEVISQRPSAATIYRALGYDVSGYHWLALWGCDSGKANFGTLDAWFMGVG